ncbi:uncharacterized protein K02A2.6-like [Topomyia yanbarensis]|uniref:uncharacterized protein K02A2.6-like n=1 Tax=Topomyia yanbarensis TaxID=2498891 RepID=UPI00273C5C4F|nr:uncharacterized protein K02A2.6-like [Topomyia yanbarensis]
MYSQSTRNWTEWAPSIVVVRKANGNIRICEDYSTGLNSALQLHQYPLSLPEDIFAKLANCKIFSQIDLSDAFLQVKTDEQYRHLLTINTHRGLYHYNRLPPGVKVAPGAFQQLVDTMLAGLKGTSGYLDDVIVGGETQEEHDHNLKSVLQRIQDFGFTIRAEKCSFSKQQIRYLGHIFDRRGLQPDPVKLDAITKLPPPTDVSGVRSSLGAINYYGKFVPNMRQLRYPLDNLLKSETKFVWNQECQQAFERFKQILSSGLLLIHYDPKQEIIVSADASSVGLGATISHKFPDGSIKVVQHASRALTKAEQNYCQPDREVLAIIFAVTTFHKMIFGRKFRLQTDHAPLLRIFGSKKGKPVATFRPQSAIHLKPEEDYVIASIILEKDVRSTPNRSAPEGKSPSELLFGRKIRTCLELLRPPPAPEPKPIEKQHSQLRFFSRNDPPFAKIYARNSWKWSPGVIVERIGDVMYNIWVEYRRILRSHINQLHSRTVAGSTTNTVGQQTRYVQLSLDILLDVWKLPNLPTDTTSLLSSTLQPTTSQCASSTPRCDQPPESVVSPSLSPLSSSSHATSSEFESAVEADPVAALPRRSSKVRRAPQWFDPYHLY